MDATGTQFAEVARRPRTISEEEFGLLVREALRGAGGSLLFSMTVGPTGDRGHVAAVSVGAGSARKLLLISIPEAGGDLVTETVAESDNPVARVAESFAGLADVLTRAA